MSHAITSQRNLREFKPCEGQNRNTGTFRHAEIARHARHASRRAFRELGSRHRNRRYDPRLGNGRESSTAAGAMNLSRI